MSEYQYLEFQAIDRPLDEADREALRALSSRARITATSFSNHYDWGDFKGEPITLMERWFDLHLYLANWGTRELMIRLPKRLVDRARLDSVLDDCSLAEVIESGEWLILDILDDSEPGDEDWDDGSGWLAALAPLRTDLLSGDWRLLYLLWLAEVELGGRKDDETEPLPGIGPLAGALSAFTEFFRIDSDLVEAAAEAAWGEVEDEIAKRNTSGYDRAATLLADLKALAEEDGAAAAFTHRLDDLRLRHSRKWGFIRRLEGL